MAIKALHHCGMVVRDLERARWFYGTVLGMTEVPRPANFKFVGAWFRFGASELHMITAQDTVAPAGFVDPGAAVKNGLATHIAFEVDDLAAMKTQLDAHGVEIKGGPMPRGDGVMQFYILDPDGYMLEFFQWVPGSEIGAPSRDRVA